MAFAGLIALLLAPGAGAQVTVQVSWLYPIETLYLADLSAYTVGRQPEFLAINLLNGATRQTVALEITLRRERPTAEVIFEGSTDPFVLTGVAERLTNRDLSCGDCPYAIAHAEVSNAWEDLLAETARFPAGSYVVEVRVLTPQGLELDRGEVRIELVNPSRIELLSPGRPFGETPDVLTNPTPSFIWSTDAGVVSTGSQYRIRVVPVENAASAEDAIQGFASWEATTDRTTALYPGAVSAIPLQPGATYAWQVVREIRSSSGTELLSSPIYWFRMAERRGDGPAGGAEGGDVGVANQLERLAALLGIERLPGFLPTGQIFVDGQPYPADRLEELLRAILSSEISVNSISVR